MDPDADIVPIAAVAPGRVIGLEGRLPWRLSEDLKRFKATTMGHPVVMGRKTFASLGKPLPGRTNIVVTRQPDLVVPEGVLLAASPLEAFRLAAKMDRRVFVIGGAQLYAAALPHARELLLTLLHELFKGDTFFPRLDEGWHVVSREDHPGPPAFSFVRLVRAGARDGCALCKLRAGEPPGPGDAALADLLARAPMP